ncbi:RNA-binding protein TIA-1, putative [Entamoeba histolytica HM-1:IMSS-B]|uniref:RNA-binding protein TIA-1, putative n=6 Tax=Entamoeba histolytica TaxID=5759 RepID=C4M9T1_ENTH1|nr:RNA-binding protein TIA-1, putative [Entamoeba histolytica HM-1:IMSS]EMD45818.1 RNA-binding protein TIA-1, putative [Entamoeba histolytica KU27]EMH78256.1 RNA-binding protein TIA-1, putative [Entamoeba histolytica HM-1:IMSS-B]EMS13815.1 RNA-binding protein TIA-1, putative [Entamoeba histolytica HM-3:IMSS]ENY60561.1 RNA-binding protein TIA-1, putative [Entamoeba histolytica HM-1:IMSS-A]GAT98478.1 RNA-binding protein tia 1 putative [Entamoeba histolytica]|eukprot:XP_649094.1 RNA-binding protein TIA-1, putative [Entamoeba histolytica HM-1:IMSS]
MTRQYDSRYQYPPRAPQLYQQRPPQQSSTETTESSLPINANSKSVHVSGIHESVDEILLGRIFSIVGHVVSCKIMRDKSGVHAGYGFVEFVDSTTARFAKDNMDGRVVYGRELKVNWSYTAQQENQGNYKIFVGGLQPEVNDDLLYKTFQKFGRVTDARVLKFTQTGKSKGYGFVTFIRKEDAETAMQMMNGEKLEGRNIKVNWVTSNIASKTEQPKRSYDEINNETSSQNCTVYIGNIPKNVESDDLKQLLAEYGSIEEVRLNKDKGYAFIKFSKHESATSAILMCNGKIINGSTLRCSWGRESH